MSSSHDTPAFPKNSYFFLQLVTCTSEKNALSAFNVTGAIGGILGNSTTITGTQGQGSNQKMNGTTGSPTTSANHGSNSDDPDCSDDASCSTALSLSSSATVSAFITTQTITLPTTAAAPIVTVTVTVDPTTFAPVTRTLSPNDALSVLSSLMAHGVTIVESPSSTPVITQAPFASQSAPTTIPLTATADPTLAPVTSQSGSPTPGSGSDGYGY